MEMSNKTLTNWVLRARKGEALIKWTPSQPVSELEAELNRFRQENARLKVEKKILKNVSRTFAAAR